MNPTVHTDCAHYFQDVCDRFGDSPFLTVPGQGQHLRFAETGRAWRQAAGIFSSHGINRGDMVFVLVGNDVAFLTAFGGLLTLGAIPVVVNPATAPADVSAMAAMLGPSCRAVVGANAVSGLAFLDAKALQPEALKGKPESGPGPAKALEDVAYVIFTSGSTGVPKGTIITHGNVLSELEAMRQAYRLTAGDPHLCVLPIFHASALFRNLLLPLTLGARVTLVSSGDPEAFWKHVQDAGAAFVQLVPSFLARLVASPAAPDGPVALKYVGTASAPCPVETIRRFEERFGILVVEAYGLTETTCGAVMSPPSAQERKLGSVGRALPGVTVEVLDAKGRALPAGQEGEIRISGPTVSPGYVRGSSASGKLVAGSIMTGDLGMFDSDGFLFIHGRKTDLIYRSGFKIAPQEVEAHLMAYDGVETAVVFGVPHDALGEDVMAVVRPAPGVDLQETALRRSLEGRLLRYKIPTRILVDGAGAVLSTETLKVSRARVRERFLAARSASGAPVQSGVKTEVRPVKPRAFLVGETIYLRPLTEADIEDPEYWDNIMTREYVWYACTGRFPQSEASIRGYWAEAVKAPNNVAFAVCDLETDERVGNMTLVIEWVSRTAEMGRFFFKKNQHAPYSIEAVRLAMRYCFEDLKLHRMWASGANPSSIPGFLKNGWVYEGRMRSHDLLGGRWRDLFIMGILEEEYFSLKAGKPLKKHSASLHDPEILEKVIAAAAEAFNMPEDAMSGETSPRDVPLWDSLGEVLFWSLLEERFGVPLLADDMVLAMCLGDLAILLEGKLSMAEGMLGNA